MSELHLDTQSPTIGVGILSWRSHGTLRRTIASHAAGALFAAADETVIWFQDISDADCRIAARHGIPCAGGPNEGIGAGMINLAKTLQTDLVLFLENDCPTVESAHEVEDQFARARRLFRRELVEMIRFRHRWKFGEGFDLTKHLRYFVPRKGHPEFTGSNAVVSSRLLATAAARRLLRPGKADRLRGLAVYLEDDPAEVHPRAITKLPREHEFYVTDSRYLPWTNQSVLVGRELFLETLAPFLHRNPTRRGNNDHPCFEPALNCRWWRRQRFRIGIGRGLFSHARFDGSWRPNHRCFERFYYGPPPLKSHEVA